MAHHTTAREAGAIFERAKPKLAAFAHLAFLVSEQTPPASVDDLIEGTRQTYASLLEIGEDLMSLEIGEPVRVRRPGNEEI
jgi:ribonuclease Z